MNFGRILWQNGSKLCGMIFFLLFYLFLSLYVDLRLLYYVTGATAGISGFPCEWSYLFETLSQPGGLVRYVSVLLMQFFMFRWVGPLVVVLQVWVIALCIDRIAEKCDGKWFGWVRYVPGIVILFFYTSYVNHFETTMAMLVVLIQFVYNGQQREMADVTGMVYLVDGRCVLLCGGGQFTVFVDVRDI
jgi:hypothetical protein